MAAPLKGANVLKRFFRIFKGRNFSSTATCSQTLAEKPNLAATYSQPEKVNRSSCKTSETDLSLHTHDHEGLFFEISENDRNTFYKAGQSKHLGQMFNAFGESCIMVRKPMLEVKSLLNATDYNLPVNRYIFYGRLGSGKSLSMAYLMHYCSAKDWLLIHIPWAALITRSWRDFQASPFQPGKVDNPVEAADWLGYFYAQNKLFIEKHQPVIQNSYEWTKRESVEAGAPWTEVIDFAISRNKYACDAIGILLKEIKHQACEKRFRVLVAIDGVNTFWEPTTIKREDHKVLKYKASELTFVHYFKKMLQNDWTNGAVVCTVDERASTTFKKDSFLPMYLLGQEGFECFDPFIPIQVENYSEKEAHSQWHYFLEKKWIQNPTAMTDKGMKEALFLSSRNPYEMYRATRGW